MSNLLKWIYKLGWDSGYQAGQQDLLDEQESNRQKKEWLNDGGEL